MVSMLLKGNEFSLTVTPCHDLSASLRYYSLYWSCLVKAVPANRFLSYNSAVL